MNKPGNHTTYTAVLGEILVDLVGTVESGFKPCPGGSMFNTAVTLAHLGAGPCFFSRIGDDFWGRYLLTYMKETSIDTGGILVENGGKTALAFALVDANGEATYDFYKDESAGDPVIPDDQPPGIVHFGSYYAVTPKRCTVVTDFLQSAIKSGSLICYDPNIRNHDPAEILHRVEENLTTAHVVKASTDDMRTLFGITDIAGMFERIYEYNTRLVIITDGENGSYAAMDNGIIYHAPAVRTTVVDTIGAGDSFSAASIFYLVQAGISGKDSLPADENLINLPDMLAFCNSIAALAVSTAGAMISPGAIREFLQR
jgi:fructokinase